MEEPHQRERRFSGRLFSVEVLHWPDRTREVVRHPGAVGIVALTEEHEVVLVRQVREAVGESVLEIPAGILEPHGESPGEAAARELAEETGYRASEVESLGSILTSPGFADERIHLFVARAERTADPEEGIEVVLMIFAEAVAATLDGRITDAKTVSALLRAALRRGSVT